MWKLDLYSDFTSNSNPYPLRKNSTQRSRNGRKGYQHTATRYYYPEIPEDILIDVLSRLSLKHLARFKSVSKRWKELISNTITVVNHPKLLISSKLGKTPWIFHSLDDHEANVKRVNMFQVQYLFLHSSCYGLLLIQVNNDLFVWNPLTKFFRKVLEVDEFCSCSPLIDLCFDYASNEYKVVLFKGGNYFDVFTCGTSIRKSVSVPDWVCSVQSGPFFRGYIHWICKGRCNGRWSYYYGNNSEYIYDISNHIVYFDPSINKLVEIPIPQPKNDVRHFIVGFGVLDGCLCMTRRYERESNIELLVMKEYGNGESWDVLFFISDVPGSRKYDTVAPLFITKNAEILVFVNIYGEQRGVRAYDIYGNFLREILIPYSDDKSFSSSIVYEESWFSPTSYNLEQFSHESRKIWNSLDVFKDFFGYEQEYSDWEENINFTLIDSFEEELLLLRRKKKRNKMLEKKSRAKDRNPELWRSLVEINARMKGRKRNKKKLRIEEPTHSQPLQFIYM